jgi:hypothetical protein
MFKEELKSNTSDLVNNIKNYVNIRSALLRCSLYEGFSRILADAITLILIFALVMIMLVFGSLAVAVWLKDIFGSYIPGFLIIAGFYLILCIILLLFKEKIILNPLIRKIGVLEKDEEYPVEGMKLNDIRNVNDLNVFKSKLKTEARITEHKIQSEYEDIIGFFSFQNLKKQFTSYLLELSESMLFKLGKQIIDFFMDKFSRKKDNDVERKSED